MFYELYISKVKANFNSSWLMTTQMGLIFKEPDGSLKLCAVRNGRGFSFIISAQII